jgi:hypothetical protein
LRKHKGRKKKKQAGENILRIRVGRKKKVEKYRPRRKMGDVVRARNKVTKGVGRKKKNKGRCKIFRKIFQRSYFFSS